MMVLVPVPVPQPAKVVILIINASSTNTKFRVIFIFNIIVRKVIWQRFTLLHYYNDFVFDARHNRSIL